MRSASVETELGSTKVFEVLLDALKDAYKEMLDLGLKISGVVIVVLGWFAAQANPLAFFCNSPAFVNLALFLVVAGLGLICLLFGVVYRRAQLAMQELASRGFEAVLYARFEITKSMLAGGILAQAMMLGGIFLYILYKYSVHGEITCASK
jgi:hypothetical protein